MLQSLVARTQPTVLDPGSPAAEDPFGRLLASAGPELRFELWRQVYLARSDLLWGLHEDLEQARPSWGRWVQEGLPNERLRALSWALGAMSGYTYRQLQSAEAEAERSLRLVERLGPLEPSDYLHGLGVGLGQRWGYDPSVRADLIRRVGEVGSIDAFTAGFDMASELHFVRP